MSNLTRGYERYGGLIQTYPLTEEHQQYDDTCREIDRLQNVLQAKSLQYLTAGEFMTLSYYCNKTFFFPKQSQLDKILATLTELLNKIEQRETVTE